MATIVSCCFYGAFMLMATPATTLVSAEVAGRQFDNTDSAYLHAVRTMNAVSFATVLPLLLLCCVLLLIWWRPLRLHLQQRRMALAILFLLGLPHAANAYWNTVDKTEAYEIMPNESVFWVPNTGANRDSQVEFDSEAYWNEHKVAAKLFVVPHVKLANTGGWMGFDPYVPAGRLFIVDRTPYSREWVAAAGRGSSNRDESFPCQTKEGLNVSTGVSIGASVLEADAAKFLARFGVRSLPGDRTDPNVIFTSAYYGRSLVDVMDDVGRKKVQTLVCDEFYKRGFDQANAEAPAMMTSIRQAAAAYFNTVGITLDFLGWADTWTFDPVVQQAINDRYAAEHIAPVLDTLKAKAALDTLRKWNGAVPSTVTTPWIPSGVEESIEGWIAGHEAPR
jgi:hypothetical protein